MDADQPSLNRAPGYVIECAASDRRRFEATVVRTPSLRQLQERGGQMLRGFPTLLTDVFCFFYAPQPRLRDDPTFATDRLNYFIVKFLCGSQEYQALQRRTRLAFDLALTATEQFGEKLLSYVESTQRASMGAKIGSLLRRVKIVGVTIADRLQAGAGEPSEEALLAFAKEIDESLSAYRVLSDLDRSWGSEPGALQQLSYEQRAALARQVQDNPKLRRLAELVGRYRQLAIHKQQTRIAELPHEVVDITQGDDWSRMLDQERVVLTHPILRYDLYQRMIEGKVPQYELRGEETVGKGSLVMCIDTSGSMSGEPEMVAKAITLGLVEIARLQQRQCVAILFSSANEWLSLAFGEQEVTLCAPGQPQASLPYLEGVMRLGTDFFGGGTDFESPLREAMRVIQEDEAGCKDGDIVFLTDDQCEVRDEFLEEYRKVKAARGFSTYSVIIGARASEAQTLSKFSDEVVSSFDLTEEIAGRIFEAV